MFLRSRHDDSPQLLRPRVPLRKTLNIFFFVIFSIYIGNYECNNLNVFYANFYHIFVTMVILASLTYLL